MTLAEIIVFSAVNSLNSWLKTVPLFLTKTRMGKRRWIGQHWEQEATMAVVVMAVWAAAVWVAAVWAAA
jgi:hypothetical protein